MTSRKSQRKAERKQMVIDSGAMPDDVYDTLVKEAKEKDKFIRTLQRGITDPNDMDDVFGTMLGNLLKEVEK